MGGAPYMSGTLGVSLFFEKLRASWKILLYHSKKENFGDHLSLQGVDDNTEELGHDEEQNQIYR